MSARCGSCRSAIEWARTEAGKSVPIDALPVADGNLAVRRVDGELHTRVVRPDEVLGPDEKRGVSHFATCPNAGQHRKRGHR
jgi:hypothetical protein